MGLLNGWPDDEDATSEPEEAAVVAALLKTILELKLVARGTTATERTTDFRNMLLCGRKGVSWFWRVERIQRED